MTEIKRKRKPKNVSTNQAEQAEEIQDFQSIEEAVTEPPKEERPKSKIKKAILPEEEEITEIDHPAVERGLYRVFIRGGERYLTKNAILVASKDKSLALEIPESTDFELPNVRRCKDC